MMTVFPMSSTTYFRKDAYLACACRESLRPVDRPDRCLSTTSSAVVGHTEISAENEKRPLNIQLKVKRPFKFA